MALWGMFKSAKTREAELKTRVRMGSNKIDQFIRQLTAQSNKYNNLAKRSFELGDQNQFREMAVRYLRCLDTINRWQRYQVRLTAMELQKNEVKATKEFLQSMNALTTSILTGVDAADVAKISHEIELAESKCEELEQELSSAMENHVGQVWDLPENANPSILLKSEKEGAQSHPAHSITFADDSSNGQKNDNQSLQYVEALDQVRQSIEA